MREEERTEGRDIQDEGGMDTEGSEGIGMARTGAGRDARRFSEPLI